VIGTTIGSLLLVILFEIFWPEVIPFTFTQFLFFEGTIAGLIQYAMPIFIFGIVFTLVTQLLTRNRREMNQVAEYIAPLGCLVSTAAGFFEEIAFRWLIFYGQIVSYFLLNQLFFAVFGGIGIFEWWQLNVMAPVVNFVLGLPLFDSLNYAVIAPIISGEQYGWVVGAALVTSVGQFRDAHTTHNLFGKIVVWFIGMYMFVLMFQYGLFAAMLVHFLYDLFIFLVIALDAMVEKKRGFV
jgi:hypothetical protein